MNDVFEVQDGVAGNVERSPDAPVVFATQLSGTFGAESCRLFARLLSARSQVHSVDSHRLALALAARDKLAPMIREAILSEVGLSSGNVRLTNLL